MRISDWSSDVCSSDLPAWVKRKMLSTKNSTSWPSSSRKYSAWVRPVSATRARARRLVHLAEHQGHLRVALEVDDARLDHLVIEVVALEGALSDAGEHRIAAVGLGDVVDELLDQHRLANASAAEQTDLAAARVGRQQLDDLDDGDQHLGFGRLVGKDRRLAVDQIGRAHV